VVAAVEAAAPPGVEKVGGAYRITVPLGIEEPMRCMVHLEELDLAGDRPVRWSHGSGRERWGLLYMGPIDVGDVWLASGHLGATVLSQEVAEAAAAQQRVGVTACLTDHAGESRRLARWKEVRYRVTVSPDGRITSARAVEPKKRLRKLRKTKLHACLVEALSEVETPSWEGDAPVEAVLPVPLQAP